MQKKSAKSNHVLLPLESTNIKTVSKNHQIVFALCILVTLTALVMVYLPHNKFEMQKVPYCLTAKCIEIAGRILQDMNQNIDPCDDFYEYACGNWRKRNVLSPTQLGTDKFTEIRKRIEILLVRRIKSWENSTHVSKRNAYLFYKSCIGENRKENPKTKAILLKMIRDLGNTSLLGDLNTTFSDFKHSFGALFTKYFIPCFINIGVNFWNFSNSFIEVIPDFPTDVAIKSVIEVKNVKKYKSLMKQTFKKLGSLLNDTEIDDKINEIIELEKKFIAIIENSKLWKPLNSTNIGDTFTLFSWKNITSAFISALGLKLGDHASIQYMPVDFFNNLTDLFRITDPDTLRNYVVWQGVYKTLDWCSNDFRDPLVELKKFIQKEPFKERWEYCFKSAKKYIRLKVLLSASYLETYTIDSLSRKESSFEEMLKFVKKAFEKFLRKASWVDSESYELLMNKFNLIKEFMLFPKFLLNDASIQHSLDGINLSSTSYFENNLKLQKADQFYLFQHLKSPDILLFLKLNLYPIDVNAGYYRPLNMIFVADAIATMPFFNIEKAMSLNFGGLAHIIGHEFSHAFDKSDINYDATYKIRNTLSNSSNTKYNEMSSCLIEQYERFKFHGMNVKGSSTLDENIADNFAMHIVYKAYKDWVMQYGKSLLYPGLGLQDNQLVFLAMAQTLCHRSTKEDAEIVIEEDIHAPKPTRVWGIVQNNNDFARAFNCKPNSKMNPTKKCEIL